MPKKNILFVCEMNTCRSQMAEGWAHNLHPDELNAFSAGIITGSLDPLAVKVMKEENIDISGHETHTVKDFLQEDIDWVITVCDTAAQQCPRFPPEVNIICQSFDNPPELARNLENEEDKLAIYRRVRDEIRTFIKELPKKL
ncbi:arsenate reductase ArsC [Desulfobacter hydrogenophilus]|uniref:Arsenate reductase ArsC n=1 Tax=Desulfobacter hydrogenophilus TaxID=2291 RepID=A0A328FDJ3_9BACT|nr:arsenate reductase ArsC [Desulfobacter hydrogenophilus]NDY71227.1 arsenate reductase ArsC [Desulfobacter hydrogenophilus]QBH15032.1 arsenate reductase ArsC [Desulfobacter hydrogenophilus]RAM02721.1 arsenate reductase ArsC [Desulfobacter hydrogenophilus]